MKINSNNVYKINPIYFIQLKRDFVHSGKDNAHRFQHILY